LATGKRAIKKAIHLQARGLFALAHSHARKAREAEDALANLLGYRDGYCGCISDEVYEARGDFDGAMRREGFTVSK